MPYTWPDLLRVVTTVTPLEKRESAWRKSYSETAICKSAIYLIEMYSAKDEHFDKPAAMADNLTAMAMLEEFLGEVRRITDETLERLVPTANVEPAKLHRAIRWSLFAGGKRIRPAIVFASGQTFGASLEHLAATAAAVEMLHTYSLIHDDLPAMDDDELRRGKATCHKQFGDATAILAGDVLQTLAFKAVAEDATLSSDVRVALIAALADGAGTPNGMVSGQQLDLEGEGSSLSLSEVEQIHRQKTGALITAAAAAGAIIGEAPSDELGLIRSFAGHLGLLFQITDDLLDVTQPTEALGKTAGKDASSDKATYPSLLGVAETRSLAEKVRQDALSCLTRLKKETAHLRSLVDLITDRTR